MSLGTHSYFARCPPAAKGPVGSLSLSVGRSWHDRPYYVGRPDAMCSRTEGVGRNRPLEATGLATLWRRGPAALGCPSRGDTHHPVSPWPQWLTSSTSARATTAP